MQERLTKKRDIKVQGFTNDYALCKRCGMGEIIDKLGQLEDVLEKYAIADLEQLDRILDENLKQFTEMGYGARLWKDYHKIEEELGIDLLTLLNVLMEKTTFFTKREDGTITEDSMDKESIYDFCNNYGKTWALTKEELEK